MGNDSEVSTGDSSIPQVNMKLKISKSQPPDLSCSTCFLKYVNDHCMLLAANGTGYRVAVAAQVKSLFSGKVRNAGGDESQLLSCSVLGIVLLLRRRNI